MSKTTKAIAILGIVAGLGVAALPFNAMAAVNVNGNNTTPATDELTVKTTIKDYISIELSGATKPDTSEGATEGATVPDGEFSSTTPADDTHPAHTLNLGELANNAMVEGSVLVNVKTNNSKGYKLGIKANDNTNMVGKNDTTNHTIATGTGIANNASTSAWGFKVVKDASDTKTQIAAGMAFDTWTAVTTNNAPIVTYGESTNTDGVNTKVTFGVAANASQAADEYSATVTFTAATDATTAF